MNILPPGPWQRGVYHSEHSIRSVPIGENEYGHTLFQTERTEMGQALYLFKYRNQPAQVEIIMDLIIRDAALCEFIQEMGAIIPIPPSNVARLYQPTLVVSERISKYFKIPLLTQVLATTNREQVKNLDISDRANIIRQSSVIDFSQLKNGEKYLLFDDIFSSGSTLGEYARLLKERGTGEIYAFTLTRTKGR